MRTLPQEEGAGVVVAHCLCVAESGRCVTRTLEVIAGAGDCVSDERRPSSTNCSRSHKTDLGTCLMWDRLGGRTVRV